MVNAAPHLCQRYKSRRRTRQSCNTSCSVFNNSRLILLLMVISRSTTLAFTRHQYLQPLRTTLASSRHSLEQLTVKELRQLIKNQQFSSASFSTLKTINNNNNSTSSAASAALYQRGTLSKLKRKQDLVDYLYRHQQSVRMSTDTTNNDINENKDTETTNNNDNNNSALLSTNSAARKRKAPSMPPLDLEQLQIQQQQQQQGSTSSPIPTLSPKEAIFELVYQRYPPLRDVQQNFISSTTTNKDVAEANGAVDETSSNGLHNDIVSPEDEDDVDIEVGTAPELDFRQIYHPIIANRPNVSEMDVVFVGTASCIPGTTRGVSCTALRLTGFGGIRRNDVFSQQLKSYLNSNTTDDGNGHADSIAGIQTHGGGGTWLFDCGEGTQLQIQRTSAVRAGKITKIFITHAHGDHTFGLPGLLCIIGRDRPRDAPPVEIYGPEGLRVWLRVAIRYSVSRVVPPYRVHELYDIPVAPEWGYNRRTRRYYYDQRYDRDKDKSLKWPMQGMLGEDDQSWISRANSVHIAPSSSYGEVPGGRNIRPNLNHPESYDGAPVWDVIDSKDSNYIVRAAPMSHNIPCVGYVVEEKPRPGKLRNDIVEPMVKKNFAALKDAGFRQPMKCMAVIKNLKPGQVFTFPDGTKISQEEAVDPPCPGRKIVIGGDTCDCRSLTKLGMNADLLIHEATNAYLAGLHTKVGGDLRSVTREAVSHGHSTPELAGKFAKLINARALVLNHFSARYKGDASVESLSIVQRIEQQAQEASGLPESSVAAAWDFMLLPIPKRQPGEVSTDGASGGSNNDVKVMADS